MSTPKVTVTGTAADDHGTIASLNVNGADVPVACDEPVGAP